MEWFLTTVARVYNGTLDYLNYLNYLQRDRNPDDNYLDDEWTPADQDILRSLFRAINDNDVVYVDANRRYIMDARLCTHLIRAISESGNLKMVQYAYYMGWNISIFRTCLREHCDVVDWLVSRVVLPDNILIQPCKNGNMTIFNTLIQAGANVNLPTLLTQELNQELNQDRNLVVRPIGGIEMIVGLSVRSPFHIACSYGHKDIVLQLYLHGADIHAVYKCNGDTINAIHSTIQGNSKHKLEIVEMLLDWGVQQIGETTPLDLSHNDQKLVDLLLKYQ